MAGLLAARAAKGNAQQQEPVPISGSSDLQSNMDQGTLQELLQQSLVAGPISDSATKPQPTAFDRIQQFAQGRALQPVQQKIDQINSIVDLLNGNTNIVTGEKNPGARPTFSLPARLNKTGGQGY